MGKVEQIWTRLINYVEPEVTLELDEIIYSRKHGHEICVMHLVGKNIFPKMTTEEILSNERAMAGLSKTDLITITRLDMEIKQRTQKLRLTEYDRNGVVTLENEFGDKITQLDKLISIDDKILNQLKSSDAHQIGYKVGFKDGEFAEQQKHKLLSKVKRILNIFGK